MTEEPSEDLEIDYSVKTPRCHICNSVTAYSARWDTGVCKTCNRWTSLPCSAKKDEGMHGCMISCWDRPKRPFVVQEK